MALVATYLFGFITSKTGDGGLNGSYLLCGVAEWITGIFELPIYFYSEYLLKKFGNDALLILSMTSYVIRVFGYTYLNHDRMWYILCLEILHGFTYAGFNIAALDYGRKISSEKWITTI
mgnify:CR=1 FL=1